MSPAHLWSENGKNQQLIDRQNETDCQSFFILSWQTLSHLIHIDRSRIALTGYLWRICCQNSGLKCATNCMQHCGGSNVIDSNAPKMLLIWIFSLIRDKLRGGIREGRRMGEQQWLNHVQLVQLNRSPYSLYSWMSLNYRV